MGVYRFRPLSVQRRVRRYPRSDIGWITVAPPEHDDLLLHRIVKIREGGQWNQPDVVFASHTCSYTDLLDDLQSSARCRLVVSNRYPALAVGVFKRVLHVIFDNVVSCPPAKHSRVSRSYGERICGSFGSIASFCSVVEAQVDGRLHVHALLYGSALTPELLTRVACRSDLSSLVESWLESVCCTRLHPAAHEW